MQMWFCTCATSRTLHGRHAEPRCFLTTAHIEAFLQHRRQIGPSSVMQANFKQFKGTIAESQQDRWELVREMLADAHIDEERVVEACVLRLT